MNVIIPPASLSYRYYPSNSIVKRHYSSKISSFIPSLKQHYPSLNVIIPPTAVSFLRYWLIDQILWKIYPSLKMLTFGQKCLCHWSQDRAIVWVKNNYKLWLATLNTLNSKPADDNLSSKIFFWKGVVLKCFQIIYWRWSNW